MPARDDRMEEGLGEWRWRRVTGGEKGEIQAHSCWFVSYFLFTHHLYSYIMSSSSVLKFMVRSETKEKPLWTGIADQIQY